MRKKKKLEQPLNSIKRHNDGNNENDTDDIVDRYFETFHMISVYSIADL